MNAERPSVATPVIRSLTSSSWLYPARASTVGSQVVNPPGTLHAIVGETMLPVPPPVGKRHEAAHIYPSSMKRYAAQTYDVALVKVNVDSGTASAETIE